MLDKTTLGKRIKKVRESRHLTLKNIEAEARISATHISEIERGKTSPTLGALVRIAKALGKEPAYFMEDEDLGEISLVTAENRIQESLPQHVGTIERLTASIPGGRLQSCIIKLDAGKTYQDTHEHRGNEAVTVLKGQVLFTVAGDQHAIERGDSIFYDASEPHNFANTSPTEPAILFWACSERNVT